MGACHPTPARLDFDASAKQLAFDSGAVACGVAPRSKPAAGRLTRPIQVGVCPPARAPPRPTPADAWLRARVPAAGIPAGIARMPTYVAKLGNWEAAVAAAEGGASAGAAQHGPR